MTNDTTTAPAPAADAATGERVKWETLPAPCKHGKLELCDLCAMTAERDTARAELRAEVEQHIAHIDALRVARAEVEDLMIALQAKTRDAMMDESRAEAAEADRDHLAASNADRDRLGAELAAVRLVAAKATNALQGAANGSAGAFDIIAADADRQRARAERAEAEVAALRGAWEEVSRAANKIQDWDGTRLGDAMEAMEAALATATPTPPAAEAVTGGEWSREAKRGQSGLYWLLLSRGDRPRLLDVFWPSDGPIVAGLGAPSPGDILLWGPPFIGPPPDGWREALAALDTPQEADHAR